MLKTISAALLAVTVLAAPAMAAGVAKTAPVTKTETTKATSAKIASAKIAKPAPAIKAVRAKPGVMNANARMGRHHYRHHHFHKHMGAYKAHSFSKVTLKHNHSAVKRG
jgi:hypothetical protein